MHISPLGRWSAVLMLAMGVTANADDPRIPGFRLENGAWTVALPQADPDTVTPFHREWPPMPGLAENPMTPEKVELGRLLFFDPVVGADKTTSCASCHHPDFGLSDGRARAMGFGGVGSGPARTDGLELGRNSPTLWNVAFNPFQFWDGRANDLEHQADFPIQAPDEMNQDPDELVFELREIPEYVALFDRAFEQVGEEAVTYENAVQAIAAFERTLLSVDARFDRWARGERDALTVQEREGFRLFRSRRLSCIECHTLPTFSDTEFHVIGVPEPGGRPDPGRAKVPGEGPPGAFKVPTLRNIALTAPYMHNGVFETLDEVIDFYAEGAGHAHPDPSPHLDERLQPFTLTEDERDALVAFLHALTDTSLSPEVPAAVPSGLPLDPAATPANPR